MTVFRGYMLLIKRNLGIMFMYMAIFLAITFIIEMSMKDTGSTDFREQRMKVAVLDEDESDLSEGIREYLGRHHDIVPLTDSEEEIQERIFHGDVEYVVRIREGMQAEWGNEDQAVETTKIPGSYQGYFGDSQVNSFLNMVRVYTDSGYPVAEAVDAALAADDTRTEVELLDQNGNGGERENFSYFFRYLPYLYIAVLCYSLGTIMVEVKKKDLRQRMQSSAVSLQRQNVEAALAYIIIGTVFWMITIGIAVILYRRDLLQNAHLGLYLLNSYVLMLVALAMSYLVGSIVNNKNVVNNIVNVLSLGMCFLGGVFVEMEILGGTAKKIANFLPVYWYEIVNGILSDHSTLTGELASAVTKGIGIQLLFVAACFGLALALVRARRQEK